MAVLDHLVPALVPVTYGKASPLDALPINVWMQSGIRPMNRTASKPSTFRYRVVLRSGERRVETAYLSTHDYDESRPEGQRSVERREPVLMLGTPFLSGRSEFLPKIQHAAFARTATVDPKQDWKTEYVDNIFEGLGLSVVGSVFRVFILYPALFIGGIYGLSKIANRVLPKGGER